MRAKNCKSLLTVIIFGHLVDKRCIDLSHIRTITIRYIFVILQLYIANRQVQPPPSIRGQPEFLKREREKRRGGGGAGGGGGHAVSNEGSSPDCHVLLHVVLQL